MHLRMITIGRHNGETIGQFERRVWHERRRRDLVREAHATGVADALPLHIRDPEEALQRALDKLRQISKVVT